MAQETTPDVLSGQPVDFPDANTPGWTREVLRSDIHTISQANRRFCDFLRQSHVNEETLFAVKLGLEEALANAVKHGNQRDPGKTVVFRHLVTPQYIAVTVTDQGEGFNLGAVPDPTLDENLEVPHGRGIMLMRAYLDHVSYNAAGTQVCMLKLRP